MEIRLDDTRFYTKDEMLASMSAAAEFAHVSEKSISEFLDSEFMAWPGPYRDSSYLDSDILGDLIRAHNSGYLPKLYRPAETIEAASQKLGALCAVCLNSKGFAFSSLRNFLFSAPAIAIDCKDPAYPSVIYQGCVCYKCANMVSKIANRQYNVSVNPYGDLDEDLFAACAVHLLREPSFKKRLREAPPASLRFDPRRRNIKEFMQ